MDYTQNSRFFWFQLTDYQGVAYKNSGADKVKLTPASDIADFRDAVKAKNSVKLAQVDSSDLLVYENKEALLANKESLKASAPLNGMGNKEENALIVVVPGKEIEGIQESKSTNIGRTDGIDPTIDHLDRSKLQEKVMDKLRNFRFLVLSSPAASGKTSLLHSLPYKYPLFKFIYMGCLRMRLSLDELLLNSVTDAFGHQFDLKDGRHYIIILDDAQAIYHDHEFWNTLIKIVQLNMPNTVKFIFSATYLYTSTQSSPASFQSFPRLSREDFLLNEQESMEFLNSSYGLPMNMQFDGLKDVIIKQCNGHIGSLRITVDSIISTIRKDECPKESELLRYFLSRNIVPYYERCFSHYHLIKDEGLTSALINCLLSENLFIGNELVEEYSILAKSGILILTKEEDRIFFSSTLAKRYFMDRFLPGRSDKNPTTLQELVQKCIQNMSASVLKQSVIQSDFPKEATFQHHILSGLLKFTTQGTSILPELSKSFTTPNERIPGAVDFYIDGSLVWGLELLVNGDRISEHMERFGLHGKYATLCLSDYAVIDFRVNKTGEVTDIDRYEKKITVFFKAGDFSQCKCIFGSQENVEILKLNP